MVLLMRFFWQCMRRTFTNSKNPDHLFMLLRLAYRIAMDLETDKMRDHGRLVRLIYSPKILEAEAISSSNEAISTMYEDSYRWQWKKEGKQLQVVP